MVNFIPHDGPQTDYFITTNDNSKTRELLEALGATVHANENYTAYVWDSRLKDTFLSGAGVLDSNFRLGPTSLPRMPRSFGSGTYHVVQLLHDGARVVPDTFGILPVYYSDTAVTNRLHLAALVEREIDAHNSMSATYDYSGFSFQFNTLHTPVRGFKLVESGHVVIVDGAKVTTSQFHLENSFEILSKDEYWGLIERGAEDLVRDIIAMVDSDYPIYTDITGGKDSRLVFGAIVAAGRQKDVIFNTIANPSNEGQKVDLDIATGLVSRYGGTYNKASSVVGYSHHSVVANMVKRRSQVFGSYHWITPSDISPVRPLNKKPFIRVMGGGGEVYRSRWNYLLFTKTDLDQLATPHSILDMLTSHQPKDRTAQVAQDYFYLYCDQLVSDFMRMPGPTLGHKMDSHFLNFRNRFHFTQKQSNAESMFGLSIANSPALLSAYRGLPSSERQIGRVAYDVMRTFDEKLPHYPFDKPLNPKIFTSPYHRKSMVEERELTLVPKPEIALRPRTVPPGVEFPTRPVSPDYDFSGILDQEIERSRDVILSSTLYKFLNKEDLDNLINWSSERSIAQKSAIASKLTAFADYTDSTK